MAVRGHIGNHLSEIGDVGEHDCVGNQAGTFQLFFLLHRIAALDYRVAEADPVEGVIVGLDLGGLGADVLAGCCERL